MPSEARGWAPIRRSAYTTPPTWWHARSLTLLLSLLCLAPLATIAEAHEGPREQYVPVLGVTMGEKPAGIVIYVMVLFTERGDSEGLDVHFLTGPGRFAQKTQAATIQAIGGAARALGLSTDSWSVGLSVPYPDLVIEGDSLSAMIGLSVAAMAKREAIPRHRVISGTVTADGRIGPVGNVSLKIAAAYQAGLHLVLMPPTSLGKEKMPYLTRVSSVGTVLQAYQALTMPQDSIAGSHPAEADTR